MSKGGSHGPGIIGAVVVVFVVLCVLEYAGRHTGVDLNPVGWLNTAVNATVTWFDTDVTPWARRVLASIEENT